jgi:hypothetical protein
MAKMLTNSIEPVDLLAERLKLEKLVPSEVQEYFFLNKMICMKCITQLCIINKRKSLSLEKTQFYRKIDWHKGSIFCLKMEPF